MEQCHMHPQQTTHSAHDAASLDSLQSPFFPSFGVPELLDGSQVTQAPHSSPSYVQHEYAPDSGASIEGRGSAPLPYHLHEHLPHQGHPRLNPSPPPQQYQHFPSVAHPLFPHGHEEPYSTPQGLSPQLPRAPTYSAPMHMRPWPIDAFSDNATAQSPALRGYGSTYPLHPQPLPVYPPSPTHHLAPAHAPPEHSQPSAAPGSSTLHKQREERAIIDQASRPHQWGGVGSLDPATGVFSQASDHPRMRTQQACEKCRRRKAKCSGEHPTCQRCHDRGLDCTYNPERRMRGPNKPKLPLPSMPDGSPQQPADVQGQKPRKRASTMPSVQRRGMYAFPGQQQRQQQRQQKQNQQRQEQVVVPTAATAAAAAASPTSSASSAGSESLGYPPLSESEASPMTPHSSLDGRHSTGVSFPTSPRAYIQEFSTNTLPGVPSDVSEGNRYDQRGDHDGGVATEGMVSDVGAYGQGHGFPELNLRLSFENHKSF